MARKQVQYKTKPLIRKYSIHSVNEFEVILKYERARADRAGSSFSLVTLEVEGYHNKEYELKRLLKALRERIRTTDQLGWLDDRTIGILLPRKEPGSLLLISREIILCDSNRRRLRCTATPNTGWAMATVQVQQREATASIGNVKA